MCIEWARSDNLRPFITYGLVPITFSLDEALGPSYTADGPVDDIQFDRGRLPNRVYVFWLRVTR